MDSFVLGPMDALFDTKLAPRNENGENGTMVKKQLSFGLQGCCYCCCCLGEVKEPWGATTAFYEGGRPPRRRQALRLCAHSPFTFTRRSPSNLSFCFRVCLVVALPHFFSIVAVLHAGLQHVAGPAPGPSAGARRLPLPPPRPLGCPAALGRGGQAAAPHARTHDILPPPSLPIFFNLPSSLLLSKGNECTTLFIKQSAGSVPCVCQTKGEARQPQVGRRVGGERDRQLLGRHDDPRPRPVLCRQGARDSRAALLRTALWRFCGSLVA